jgi:hypothetical protein
MTYREVSKTFLYFILMLQFKQKTSASLCIRTHSSAPHSHAPLHAPHVSQNLSQSPQHYTSLGSLLAKVTNDFQLSRFLGCSLILRLISQRQWWLWSLPLYGPLSFFFFTHWFDSLLSLQLLFLTSKVWSLLASGLVPPVLCSDSLTRCSQWPQNSPWLRNSITSPSMALPMSLELILKPSQILPQKFIRHLKHTHWKDLSLPVSSSSFPISRKDFRGYWHLYSFSLVFLLHWHFPMSALHMSVRGWFPNS